MGWSRYAQGFRHMALNSGLFYVKASDRTVDLMKRIAGKLHAEKAWDQSVYNEFIFTLSHGDYTSPQVSGEVGGVAGRRAGWRGAGRVPP